MSKRLPCKSLVICDECTLTTSTEQLSDSIHSAFRDQRKFSVSGSVCSPQLTNRRTLMFLLRIKASRSMLSMSDQYLWKYTPRWMMVQMKHDPIRTKSDPKKLLPACSFNSSCVFFSSCDLFMSQMFHYSRCVGQPLFNRTHLGWLRFIIGK